MDIGKTLYPVHVREPQIAPAITAPTPTPVLVPEREPVHVGA